MLYFIFGGCHSHDRMVVGFTTTCANQCLSPIKLRSWRGVLDTTLCDKVCQ